MYEDFILYQDVSCFPIFFSFYDGLLFIKIDFVSFMKGSSTMIWRIYPPMILSGNTRITFDIKYIKLNSTGSE